MIVLITHIVIALAGLAEATYLLVRPSRRKLMGTYVLLAATIASGTYLVIQRHAPVLSSCLSGLLYTGVVLTATLSAQYRLVKARARI